jgi:hypothetical protein
MFGSSELGSSRVAAVVSTVCSNYAGSIAGLCFWLGRFQMSEVQKASHLAVDCVAAVQPGLRFWAGEVVDLTAGANMPHCVC